MATLTEMANLTAADLKAQAAELAESIKDDPDTPKRCVQNLLDAKMRDEKLSEQGATITNLNAALEKATADIAAAAGQVQDLSGAVESAKQVIVARDKVIDELREQLKSQTELAKRFKQLATSGKAQLRQANATIGAFLDAVNATENEGE